LAEFVLHKLYTCTRNNTFYRLHHHHHHHHLDFYFGQNNKVIARSTMKQGSSKSQNQVQIWQVKRNVN